jgi:hypothetical protein
VLRIDTERNVNLGRLRNVIPKRRLSVIRSIFLCGLWPILRVRPGSGELYRPAVGHSGPESRSSNTVLPRNEQCRTTVRHHSVKSPTFWPTLSIDPATVFWVEVTTVVMPFEDEVFLISGPIGPLSERDKLFPVFGDSDVAPL